MRIHRWLSANAAEWARLERDEGNLMRGAQLAEVEAWSVEHVHEMSGLEREFLASSLVFRKREEEREEELRQLRALELERRLDLARSDLILFVHYEKQGNDIILTYQLGIQNPKLGLVHEGFPPRRISSETFTYFKELLKRIEGLERHNADTQLKAQRRLAGIGEILFKELVPEKLRAKLWELHDPRRTSLDPAPSLQLVSDEILIPWELLKLSSGDDDTGPFLVQTFAFTRWLTGCHQTLEFPMRDIALLVATDDAESPSAKKESDLIRSLASQECRITDVPAQYNSVIDHLVSGRHDAWYLRGYCTDRGATPHHWSFILGLGDELTSHDLNSEVRRLGIARPLVFVNACRSGRGMAQAFLEASAGAFIGSQWALSNDAQFFFAQAFYERFMTGFPIGEATRWARARVRKACPGDPSWLAYTVFAHPLAAFRKAHHDESE
ncbi:MAG: CHAT domain-containing protein [bacterium]|nr:CHAT domain-containing protein [bacterium]